MEIQAQLTPQTAVNQTLSTPEVESAREDAADRGPERSENSVRPSAGPAVINNISASALQASRVATNTQVQTQNDTNTVNQTRNQNTSNEQLSSTGNQTLQTSRVDTIV